MKRNNTLYCTAALLLVILAAACTRDDDFAGPPATDAPATVATALTVTVTDGAYAPAESPDGSTPATRAVERGYGTEFTAGDRIGLYAVEIDKQDQSRRNLRYENLCLTYDGTNWTPPPPGTPLTHSTPEGGEIVYLAYYPYQDDMRGQFNIGAREPNTGEFTTETRYFFRTLVNNWRPASDQSTYAAYTASDLMVSLGTVTNGTDGSYSSELRFVMEHQMALAVIRVPSTEYTYTETVSGIETEKSYRLYTGMNTGDCWQENSHTERHLVNPQLLYKIIPGSFYTAGFEKRRFKVTTFELSVGIPGIYRLYTIDGGKAEVKKRPLEEGDFYMSDGSVLPQEAFNGGNLPADVQADCLGVVFWVGENEGRHWTQNSSKKGDLLLMRDHPGCVRGMAVALHDASQGAAWATEEGASNLLYGWADGFSGFTPAEQADWEAIKASGFGYGYCSSRLMKLYGARHPATTFPAYGGIDAYAAAHPAPDGSSGWFFPGKNELAMMCYGMADNYAGKKPTAQRDLLNGLFPKAGGEAFDGRYWSNMEDATKAWTIDFGGSTAFGNKSKSDTYHVRAVLAF